MAEYIEREAVIAEIVAEAEKQGKKSYEMAERGCDDLSVKYTHGEYCYSVAEHIVKTAPAADVEPVKRGEWKYIKSGEGVFDYYFECSECHANTPDKAYPTSPEFCPYCGSKNVSLDCGICCVNYKDGKEVQE